MPVKNQPLEAKKLLIALFASAASMLCLSSCAQQEVNANAVQSQQAEETFLDVNDIPASAYRTCYPTGWVITDIDGIQAYSTVEIKSLPDVAVSAHENGATVGTAQATGGESAVVVYNGAEHLVDASLLLVNLPDIDDSLLYDVVYSYSAPSQCAENNIAGLTGCRVDGYAAGKQADEYLNRSEYVIPCAYETYLKLAKANETLIAQGYRIKIWDAYRPYRASMFISDKFTAAWENSTAMQQATGSWGLSWYAADSPSGHNFATDIDATVVSVDGADIAMPSKFDAFDDSAHLCAYAVSASTISESNYAQAVLGNEACMAYHRAMKSAGFSELASEWWHFGDKAAQQAVTDVVGTGGMDFVAEAPRYE